MARKFLTAIDLAKNELQNGVIQNLASAPGSPVKGQVYYDSTGNILYWYNGSGWVAAQGGAGAVPATTVTTQAVGDAAVVGVATTYAREDHKHGREAFGAVTAQTAFGASSGNGAAATLPRSDHTHGTPTHVAADHSTIPLSALAAATANVSMGGFKITNVGTPTASTDAANKQYVDDGIAGLSWKEAVRAGTTANITLSAPQTVDGVAVIAGERVLVKNQSTASQNGIYTVAAGAWVRATDADSAGEMEGATVFIMEGTTLADTSWTCTANAPITVGTTSLTWAQFGAGAGYIAGNGLTLTGLTFDIGVDGTIQYLPDLIGRAAIIGDVSIPSGSNTAAIAANAVTNTMAADMAQSTIKGRAAAAGTGDPTDLTAAQVLTILGLPATPVQKFAGTVAAATSTVITHNLNSLNVVVNVYRTATPWDTIECDVERTTVNTVTVRFAVAPVLNEYTVVVVG